MIMLASYSAIAIKTISTKSIDLTETISFKKDVFQYASVKSATA